ncbi:MAG: nitroreductase [Polyangiales bacterium]
MTTAIAPAELASATSLQQLLEERRTIHQFIDRALPEGALDRALQTAIAAPNHRLTEPWRFTRSGPQTRRALLEIGLDRLTRGGQITLPPSAQEVIRVTIENPAELLIVSQVLDPRPEVRAEDYAAVACAIHNLTLALWAEGIGSKWSTTDVMEDPRTYSQLGLNPEQERIVGLLWIGYPARDEPPKARRKKSLDDVVRQAP